MGCHLVNERPKKVNDSREKSQAASLSFGFGELVGWLLLSDGGGLRAVLVQLHKLGKIELGLLEDLDLSDHAAVVLEWEDFGAALLLNLLADIAFNQDFDKVFEVGLL